MAKVNAATYILQLKMHATRQGRPAPDLNINSPNVYSDLIEIRTERKIWVVF